jgi:hypothetical protein
VADRDMLELDLGRAILTSYDGQHLLAQFDSEGDDADGDHQGRTASAEVHSPFGLDGRPRDPDTNTDGTSGIGATAMRAIEGRTQHMLVFGDPRCTDALPTLEKGSARLYGHLAGNKVAWVVIDGTTGTLTAHVPIGAGASEITIDGATGDITATHQAGTKVAVKADGAYVGDTVGAFNLLLDNGVLTAYFATVESRFASLGQSGTPPVGYAATKAKGV